MPNIKTLKMFGQHWLIDNQIAEEIVQSAAINTDTPVWEIGPGQGVLTKLLIRQTHDLTAFEIDNRLAELLTRDFGSSIRLIHRDILAVDWAKLLEEKATATGKNITLVSNLPYQITSPVLYKLEEHAHYFDRIVLMLQKEVADRLTAHPNTKAYGLMTLRLQYHYRITHRFNVPATAFAPPPKVASAVIMLTPRPDKPAIKSLDIYSRVIHKAFSQRRKTLRNNLKELLCQMFPNGKEQLLKLEQNSGIDFGRRGESLAEAEFVHLADSLYHLSLSGDSPVR